MNREVLKNDVPDLWRKRMKAGLCPVCGKTKVEFEKMMRVYCSHKCRDAYADKYTYWSEVREKVLKRDNNTCANCGINATKMRAENDRLVNECLDNFIKTHPVEIKNEQDDMIIQASKDFEIEYNKAMDLKIVAHRIINYDELHKATKSIFGIALNADHIVPVAKGGDMWDMNNIQTLCEGCHKKKTKQDIKEIIVHKKGIIPLDKSINGR